MPKEGRHFDSCGAKAGRSGDWLTPSSPIIQLRTSSEIEFTIKAIYIDPFISQSKLGTTSMIESM